MVINQFNSEHYILIQNKIINNYVWVIAKYVLGDLYTDQYKVIWYCTQYQGQGRKVIESIFAYNPHIVFW